MEYLDRLHPAFAASPEPFVLAAEAALARALGRSRSFRMELLPSGLERAIGPERLRRLLPGLPAEARAQPTRAGYVVHEERLDEGSAAELRRLVRAEEGREPPLTYVETLTLLDADGRIVLRAGDSGDAWLLSFAGADRAALLADFAERGIPADVLEPVDVDPAALHP
ncbi:MAG TPA: hypothetical protein VF746_08305 [Longimicrobium sp.]|jgi:hypothetical protein